MQPVEAPPDATVFQSRGVTYFLYLGNKELRAIQRKWGYLREPSDSAEAWAAKTLAFNVRLGSEDWEDRRDIMHACLVPWCVASGNGNGPIQLSEDEALRIFEAAQLPGEKKRRKNAAFARFEALWARFNADQSGNGPDDDEEMAGPKAPPPEGSTQSGS